MNDLVQYLNWQIKALQDQNTEKDQTILQLTGYIFELLDPETPKEYKDVIRHEVFGTKINYNYEN